MGNKLQDMLPYGCCSAKEAIDAKNILEKTLNDEGIEFEVKEIKIDDSFIFVYEKSPITVVLLCVKSEEKDYLEQLKRIGDELEKSNKIAGGLSGWVK